MTEFKIDTNAQSGGREVRRRLLPWATVLLLFGVTALIFILGFMGRLSVDSNLHRLAWLAGPAMLSAIIYATVLAFREALRRAEREMVFVLDNSGIVRSRSGYPDVKIAFSEIGCLREELGWLVVESSEPRKKIAIPKNVSGFDVIRAELVKHHAVSSSAQFPLKSAALTTISILSWSAVVWFRDLKGVIPAAVMALTLLAFASHRLWEVLRRGPRRMRFGVSFGLLGAVWLTAILLIYLRVERL